MAPVGDADPAWSPIASRSWAFTASRPSAPTALRATPVAGGQSTITWSPPTRGARSVVAYLATRRAVVNGAVQLRSDFVSARASSLLYTDLAPAVRYSVAVRPFSIAGLGPSASVAMTSPAAVPGAPTGVSATAGGDAGSVTLAWAAPAATGGAPVTGFRVVATPAGGADGAPVLLPGTARSAVLTGLTPGTRYRLSVVAMNVAGAGSAAIVEYAVPAPVATGPAVIALDTAARRVVRISPDGTVTPLGTNALAAVDTVAVDSAGTAFATDPGSDTVLRFAAGSGTQTTLGSGWTDPRQIQTDGQGRAYVLDGTRVIRIGTDGSTAVLGTVDKARFLLVDAAGNASVLWDSSYRTWRITTLPAAGGAPVVRSLEPGYGLESARIAADGTLYLERQASGGSGATWIVRVAPGSADEVQLSDRQADYAYTVDPAGALVLLQSRYACLVPEEAAGCVSDPAVDELRTFVPGAESGVATPVSALALPVGGIDAAPAGLYVARVSGGPAALVRYGVNGGAPTVIAPGSFADPEVITTPQG